MHYKNLIFTRHAQSRLNDRTITADAVFLVIQTPDKKFERDDTIKFIRTLHGRKYHVVASYLEKERRWLVISVWVRGEEDQVPVIWQLLTLPFRILFWAIKQVVKLGS